MGFEFNPADEDEHGLCRHEIEQLRAEIARLKAHNEKLTTYFNIMESEEGQFWWDTQKILDHFKEDGALKGEGKWRGIEIYNCVKRLVDAHQRTGDKLNAIDWTIPGHDESTVAER